MARSRIVAIRGERGSYNTRPIVTRCTIIVAIRGERGSYNHADLRNFEAVIVAIRGERGSYNHRAKRSHETAPHTPNVMPTRIVAIRG